MSGMAVETASAWSALPLSLRARIEQAESRKSLPARIGGSAARSNGVPSPGFGAGAKTAGTLPGAGRLPLNFG